MQTPASQLFLFFLTIDILSQIKGKESENSYQELKRSQKDRHTRKLYRDISTGTAVFLNRKAVNVCEHTTKTASLESLQKVPPGGCERDGWREIDILWQTLGFLMYMPHLSYLFHTKHNHLAANFKKINILNSEENMPRTKQTKIQ